MLISIVVPCYNEESNVTAFYDEIQKIQPELPDDTELELIFVNDGSKDRTIEIVKDLAEKDNIVKYIDFSRNFGKEAAMLAGLEYAGGDYVVVIDADLQDPPSLIPKMYEIIRGSDYERVATRRVDRKGEPPVRSFFARMFYKLINKISDVKIVDGARDFSMMSRKMVNSVLSLKEKNRFSKGLFEWAGYKTKWLEFKNHSRNAGTSKWSFWKLFSYSVEGIVSFSSYPLVLSAIFGVILCLISLFFIAVIIIKQLFFGDPVAGWASTICVILFVSGLQQLMIGIIGSYLARMFIEIKDRPSYVVLETNLKDKTSQTEKNE